MINKNRARSENERLLLNIPSVCKRSAVSVTADVRAGRAARCSAAATAAEATSDHRGGCWAAAGRRHGSPDSASGRHNALYSVPA